MSFDTIIKNGTVVTAIDTYDADVAITNGKIAAVEGPGFAIPSGVLS